MSFEARVTDLERRLMPAVVTPFAPRFSTNASGDILFVANTVMTAPASDPSAVAAQAATGTKLNDNDFSMVYVDVDGDPSTFNSSRANLALPTGGSVLFAGLYWGANSTATNRATVQFRAPGAAAYTTLNGISFGAEANNYQAFADVTALVRSAGVGTYTVANVQANTGTDRHGGWSLVVVYGDPAAPPRNLTVFDGLASVNSSTPNVTIPISGFTAPPTGLVNASIGFVGYEGDLGLTGDSVKLNNTTLSDPFNPAGNFFNSTITNKGTRVTSKNPDYVNQLGFDADIVSTSGLIPNGATSATIALTTGGETYLPGVVTTAIDLYAPVVSTSKTFSDINGGNLEPGDIIEYTDTVAITSGDAASQFVLFNPIPANTTYVPGSLQIVSGANAGAKTDAAGDDQANFDAANNRVVYRLGAGATGTAGGTIPVGSTATVRFRVQVNSTAPNGTSINSQASASFVGQTTGAGLTAASSVAAAAVIRSADLGLTQTVDNPTPNVADFVVVTTTISNAGPFDGTGILVNDLLPSGLQFDSATLSQGSYNPSTGAWAVGTVATGGQATLAIRARVVQPSPITATASIGAADLPDPVGSNNSASVVLTPQRADLSLTKAVDNPRPNVGNRINFTTTLINDGPNAATGVVINDALPAGFAFVSAAPGQGSYDPATGRWTVGTLASGATVTLVLSADVTNPAASVATASVNAAAQFDPVGANNIASAAVTPLQSDLSVATGIDNPTPNVGDIITYTVTLTNNGPDTATGVVAGPTGPLAGVQVVGVTLSQGTFDQATSTWTVGTVAMGAPQTLVVRARVTSPAIAPVTVSIRSSDQFDPNSANNSSRTAVTPQEVSLSLTQMASSTRPDANELVTFTVGLRNAGPSAATGVRVGDLLPAGLSFVSATPSRGTYDPATGNWAVGGVAASELVTLTLIARVTSPSPTTTTATILAADQFDSVTGDNSSSVTLTPKQADLLLSLSGDEPRPNVGDVVTLLFTVTNQGPDTATGVRVSGTLPAGATILSSTPSQGTFDPATQVWTLGTVDTLAPRTLAVQVRVDAPNPLVGSAAITASDQFDPNAGNNGLTVTAVPQQAALSLAETVDNPTPNVGEIVTLSVVLSNAGPDAASGVRVSQTLPAGLSFISAEPGQGTYDPAAGTWVVGTLGGAATQTLLIRARVTAPAAGSAQSSIARSDQYDPNPADNAAAVTVTPRQADLALNATISNPAPNVGELVTITLTLTDGGPDPATGVAVRDLLGPGLAFVSATPSAGLYDSVSGTWNVGTVNPGTPTTLVLVAQVTSPAPFVNTATVVAADQFDPTAGNNTATVSATPQTVDLGVVKAVDNARPNVGEVITFTTTVTNAGPSTATNALIRAAAGLGLTIVGSQPSQGTFDPVTGIWDLGSVAPLGTQVLRVYARVDGPGVVSSTASLAEVTQFDTDNTNDRSTIAVTPRQADLALSQSVDVPTPNVGQFVTYTITVANNGPDTATGVSVRDLLPAGLQFLSSTQTRGGYDPTMGLWTVGNVESGSTQVLRIVARVTAPGQTTNTASVASVDQFDPVAANNTATAASDPQQADLALTTAFDQSRPNVGDLVTYTVVLNDAGPGAASGVAVSAPLPAGLTFVSATPSQGTYDPATGTWTLGSVAAGTPQVLQITARVTTSAPTTASATITAADQFDPSPSNNSTSSTFTPQQSNLSLTTGSDNSRPNVGDVVTLTITLANAGPDAATGVIIVDALPAGLTFLSASGPGTYDPASGNWTVGAVASGSVVTLQIRAQVASPGNQTNTATVAAADQFDADPANNVASITLVPTQSDLSLGVVVDRVSPNVGDPVTFTVTLRNGGPDAATGIRIRELLPAGLSLVAATPSQGIYAQSSGVWEVGQLDPGAVATLTLQATVIGSAAATNTVSVLASDQFDPNTGDNTAAATVTPQRSDLSLSAVSSTTTPNVGDLVTLTLTLDNAGPDAATRVRVANAIPAGLTLVSATPSLGQFDAANGAWTLDSIASGAAPTLTLTLRVTSPTTSVDNASIVAVDQFDPDLDDRAASITLVPQRSELGLSATVDNPTPNVGTVVSFAITVTNSGPDAASGVTVAAPLPAGYTLVSSAGLGTYDPTTGTWTLGTIAPGGSTTLSLVARVDSPTPPGVLARIATADQFDPSAANNSASVAVVPQQSDLGVAVLVSDPTPNVGQTITYTIFLVNSGPDAATNVSLQDLLPSGVAFVSAVPEQGTYNPGTGLWTVGTVASGDELTLTLTATVADPAATVNQVTVVGADQFDPSPANNTAATSLEPQQAELRLLGRVDRPRPNVGETVSFSFTLANLGPDDATGITVDAPLPAGFAFQSATAVTGSYDSTNGVWTVASLTSGASTTLTLVATVATVVASGASTPTASIRQADQFDPNRFDNRAEVQVQPQRADLSLSSSTDNARPNVGDLVTTTITVANAGPDAATGVVIADALPPGLTFVSSDPQLGTYDPATGSWTIGTLASGTSATLRVVARVASPAPATSTALVSAVDQFDPDGGNNAASTTILPQSAGLAVAAVVDNPRPNVGDVVTIMVTLSNTGADAATGVQVASLLPAGLTLVSATPSRGVYDAATGVWSVNSINPGTSGVLMLRAVVASPATGTLVATVARADQFDPNPADNASSTTVVPRQSNLVAGLSVDQTIPNVGDIITLTATLTNTGPDASAGIVVIGSLPAGFVLVGADPEQGGFSPSSGVWSVGEIDPGATRNLRIRVRVVSPDPQTASITVSAADQFDPNPGDNTASITVTPQQANLSLVSTVDVARPNVGDLVTITVTLADAGRDPATGVRVSSPLPSNLTFVSATTSLGAYDAASGLWDVGNLPAGSPHTLTLVGRVQSPGAFAVASAVAAADQFDPDPSDNAATVTVTPQRALLTLNSSVDDLSPAAGQVITFTVVLVNQGPDAATGVLASGVLPPGLEFVSAETDGGVFDPATATWNVGTVAPGGSVTLRVRARAVDANPSLATIAVVAADQFAAAAGVQGSITILPLQSDLNVAVSSDADRPNVGDVVTLTVTVGNTGPDDGTGVGLDVVLPAGLAFVDAVPGLGTYDPATGRWSVGTIPAQGTTTLTIRARVTAASASAVSASVVALDPFDPDATDNVATRVLTPRAVDLALATPGAPTSVTIGQVVAFRVVVGNNGPDAATGVVVPVALPAGFRLVNATPGSGTFDPATGLWTVGAVPAGGFAELLLALEAVAAGDATVSVGATRSGEFDRDPSNDTLATTVSVTAVVPPVDPPPPTDPEPPTNPEPPTDPEPPTVPVEGTASLGGSLFTDLNGDGVFNFGEPGLGGVLVVLDGLDRLGNPVRLTTFTNIYGAYRFDRLLAGTYTVTAATATPGLEGQVGPGGGSVQGNRVAGIVLADGVTADGYSFAAPAPTAPATPGRITGRAFLDLYRDGAYGPGDYGLATIRVVLTGVDDRGAAVRLATTTAADGSFAFDGLRPGLYAIQQILPRQFRGTRAILGTAGGGTAGAGRIQAIRLESGATASGYQFANLPARNCNLYPLVVQPGRPAGPQVIRGARAIPRGPLITRFVPELARLARLAQRRP